jgi:hypothetical protein
MDPLSKFRRAAFPAVATGALAFTGLQMLGPYLSSSTDQHPPPAYALASASIALGTNTNVSGVATVHAADLYLGNPLTDEPRTAPFWPGWSVRQG